ncbi:hypothetical protein [Rubrobacter xylanophilus]|nr:hypothetical protein [Rubrobacter xylanophilus]
MLLVISSTLVYLVGREARPRAFFQHPGGDVARGADRDHGRLR